MSELVARYSPNFEWGKTIVEITLQQWEYRAVHTVEVGGNCLGFAVLDAAVTLLYSELEGEDGAEAVLSRGDGNTLLCVDEEESEEWLKSMVVGLRIIGIINPTLNEIRARNGAKPVDGGDIPWEAG